MPKPVIAKVAKKGTHTHRVYLEHGASYTLMDRDRPGNPWQFKQGEWQTVTAAVATRLKETAIDPVNIVNGTKVTALDQPKFKIERIEGVAAPEEAGE